MLFRCDNSECAHLLLLSKPKVPHKQRTAAILFHNHDIRYPPFPVPAPLAGKSKALLRRILLPTGSGLALGLTVVVYG
jgi:hypothetical protein